MPQQRFMIAAPSGGLQNDVRPWLMKASSGIIAEKVERCFMRKDTIDITGQTFNDLFVVRYAGKGKYRGSVWLCKCVCGTECIVPGGHLRHDMRKSCGCRSKRRLEETGKRNLYSLYKRKSRIRGREFQLSLDQFSSLVAGNCFYCGIQPSQVLKRQKSAKAQIVYNGIDRIDPDKGYMVDNCVSCCKHCNLSKSNLTVAQWKDQLRRICRWLNLDL